VGGSNKINKPDGRPPATPLYVAANNGYTDVVAVLVRAGAAVDQGAVDTGATPLCAAAQKGHADVVRVLLEAGADVNRARTTDGATPL
jgi:ankyrin repeat protein